jgi:hypothetical protein
MRATRVPMIFGLLLTLVVAPTVVAAGPGAHGKAAPRGILPATARVGGNSLGDYAGDFDVWFLSNADDNPTLNPRCEPSSLNPRVWYLPVSIGGDVEVSCTIPRGSFLLLMTGSAECSNLEAAPWYGGDAAELRACVDRQATAMTDTYVTVDGRTTHALASHLVTSGVVDMPANNLLSADAGISMIKGYFVLIAPLRPGEHRLAGWVAFGTDFAGGVTYDLTVR